MKKVLLTLSSVILLIGILLLLLYPKNNFEKEINNEIAEEIKEEIKEDKEDEYITEINEIDNNIIENDSSSISDSNKNDLESHNTSNSDVVNNKTKTVKEVKTEPKVSEPKQEIKEENNQEVVPEQKEEEPPKVKEEVRDDIIDTNSWFYSIHHGKIETSTQGKCLAAGEEIAFIDTVDINYYRCYEVTSTTGKVLGYYLNIFCNSDNCNRYKNQIDMSKYK